MLSYMKNRVTIAGGNPFVRSLDNKLTDPNIHTSEMVEPLLFGEIEIGPSNPNAFNPPTLKYEYSIPAAHSAI
jgi:hypothetical protein